MYTKYELGLLIKSIYFLMQLIDLILILVSFILCAIVLLIQPLDFGGEHCYLVFIIVLGIENDEVP